MLILSDEMQALFALQKYKEKVKLNYNVYQNMKKEIAENVNF